MTLRAFIENILDSIKNAIEHIYIDISTVSHSGNPITFNSTVNDIPLDNMVIDVQGYQEGSGVPDPVNNIRPIVNYDSVNVNLNGNVDSIQLGDTFYTGKLYPNLGLFVATRGTYTTTIDDNFLIGNQNYIKADACDAYVNIPYFKICPSTVPNSQSTDLICSHFKLARYAIWSSIGYSNTFTLNNNQLHFNIANDLLGITDYTQETVTSARAKINDWIHANPITVTFPTSRIIHLTPAQIKAIKGSNTLTANTGNIELKLVTPKIKTNI